MVIFLVGTLVGVGVAVAAILGAFKVQTKESWKEEEARMNTMHTFARMSLAENARLRVSLAAGEMTEEGKRVAAMTMAALHAVSAAASKAILEGGPGPVTS